MKRKQNGRPTGTNLGFVGDSATAVHIRLQTQCLCSWKWVALSLTSTSTLENENIFSMLRTKWLFGIRCEEEECGFLWLQVLPLGDKL